MPIPFDKFRLLNGSGKKVDSVKFKWSPQAASLPEAALLDEQDALTLPGPPPVLTPLAGGQTRVYDPIPSMFDARNITIVEIVTEKVGVPPNDKVRKLKMWPVFFPDDPVDIDANVITWFDLQIHELPGVVDEFCAEAVVTFNDGTVWHYYSSKFSEGN